MSAPVNGIGYDVATALWQGARPYQEDTLLADFHGGMNRGFAVLADGMGGHAAGDLASRLVVIDAASHLKFLMHDGEALERTLQSELTSAIETANDVLKNRAADDRRLHGMGTTFLATVLFEDRLYWASVGDSPLYLWREGQLRQLNEDHSMAPVIDQMAKTGEISKEDAANHPDRNALTSVLMGRALKVMDVPKTATVLDPGDVLIQASDGLQYLDDVQISGVLERAPADASSRAIADLLMASLRDLDDPSQDNTAVLVLQLTQTREGPSNAAGTATRTATVAPMASTERAVGATVAAGATPNTVRAATPVDVARPAGARRWAVPATLLGGTAVVLGLMFGLPNLQNTTDLAAIEPTPETFEVAVADVAPVPVPVPAAPVGVATGTATGASTGAASGAGAVAVPLANPGISIASLPDAAEPLIVPRSAPTAEDAHPAELHDIAAEEAPEATSPAQQIEITGKFAHPEPGNASGATIAFGAEPSREEVNAPSSGDELAPIQPIETQPAPRLPSQRAPGAQFDKDRPDE